nr:MAG TPA: hypothetical protein [Caudoviricetes sp.]
MDRKETSQLCSPPDGGAAKQLPSLGEPFSKEGASE